MDGSTGAYWGSAPPPDFIRNLMQAVAGHMVQGGPANTRIITRNPLAASQLTAASLDSGNTNAGQSTQARYVNHYFYIIRLIYTSMFLI